MSSRISSEFHATTLSPPRHAQDPVSIPLATPTSFPPPQQHHNQSSPPDWSSRAQWLRAAVLGANDGLVSVASLMIGIGAVNKSTKDMLVSGLAGLVAGGCSMAIGEYVSVYAQYDMEVARLERGCDQMGEEAVSRRLPSPLKAAVASFVSFAVGAMLPLLAGGFIYTWWVRVAVVSTTASLSLCGFGAAGAMLGGAHVLRSTVRVLVGGWMAMLFTYAVIKVFGIVFKMEPDIS